MTSAITFTDDELDLLLDVLKGAHGDMREQAYKAENPRFKDQLKQRERLLDGLLERMQAERPAHV
jgi:hypothetical protein